MKIHSAPTYIGINPISVTVDDSAELRILANRARQLHELPFPEKLRQVRGLALESMLNAFEEMQEAKRRWEASEQVDTINGEGEVLSACDTQVDHEKKFRQYENLVYKRHPLGDALKLGAGCCRYQSTLFFILGYEAKLGDEHFVHMAPITPNADTTFNEVRYAGDVHIVNIFRESLRDHANNYTDADNRDLFEDRRRTFSEWGYSYHRRGDGFHILTCYGSHVAELPENITDLPQDIHI